MNEVDGYFREILRGLGVWLLLTYRGKVEPAWTKRGVLMLLMANGVRELTSSTQARLPHTKGKW